MKNNEKIEMCRKILKKGSIQKKDTGFLLGLLKNHPEYKEKVGCGIKLFFVGRSIYGSPCFYIMRKDGSTTDFSFLKCVRGKAFTIEEKIKRACRNSVHHDIVSFRGKSGLIVHHAKESFNKIVEDWLKKNPCLDLRTNKTEDNSQQTFFLAEETERSFIDYHRIHANLVLVNERQHKKLHRLIGGDA